MNQARGTSIYLRRPGPLESKRNDWWRDNERFSVQVSTKFFSMSGNYRRLNKTFGPK